MTIFANRKTIIIFFSCLCIMVLYWSSATKILNQLNFICFSKYWWSNRRLNKIVNISCSLKSALFLYFLVFEAKMATMPNQELSVLYGGPTLNYGGQLSLYVSYMLRVNMTGDLAHLQLSGLQGDTRPICRTSDLQGERMHICRT